MNYIVLDLEWNQGTPDNTIKRMPFEIVEIGAVKVNSKYEIIDTFQVLIKPRAYPELNYSVHKVIPLEMEEIRQKGVSFAQAVKEFFHWCGEEEYRFCTWGSMDLTELQRNLKHFKVEVPLKTPIYYYDIQKCYGLEYPAEKGMSALEDAVTKLGIEKSEQFHRAADDARYTAEVLKQLDKRIMKFNYSVDYYKNPKNKSEELYLKYPSSLQYVSREFVSKEKLMQDREVRSTRCYVCGKGAKRKIRWFSVNSRIHYCQAFCADHGYMTGKIRIKKTDDDMFFAEKFLKMTDKEEAEQIRLRKEAIVKKRQEKKKEKKIKSDR